MPKRRTSVWRNEEQYPDPTAGAAITEVANESELSSDEVIEADARFHMLMRTIWNICNLAGFHVEEHIVVKDLKTGKVWR